MAKDYIKNTHEFGIPKMPKFKGHVKLTLHNCKNGKNEVIEGENIVTNAVRDILSRNLNGGFNYTMAKALAQTFYGGVLLYKNAHPLNNGNLDPDNYYPLDNIANPLTAHAGDAAPSSSEIVLQDLSRGAPSNTIVTETSIKNVWEWTPSQGNGQISALSLTHADTGNAGLGNTSTEFLNFNPFVDFSNLVNIDIGGTPVAAGNNIMAEYDDRRGLLYLIGDDGDYYDGHHRISSNKVTVYIIPLAYSKFGLWEKNAPTYDFVRKFTVTTSITFYGMPAFYFDYENKYLWLFNNKTSTADAFSQSTVYYTVIDCKDGVSTREVAHGTIVSDDNDLGIISVDGNQNSHAYPHVINIMKEGNYVYLPLGATPTSTDLTQGKSNYLGLKKINIADQADQAVFALNNDAQLYNKPYFKNGGIIINGNRVLNGGIGYTCALGYFTDNEANNPSVASWFLHEPNKVSSLCYPFRAYNGTQNQPRRLLASKMLNTTLFTLPSTVTKSTSTSMTVEYTLTEVSV